MPLKMSSLAKERMSHNSVLSSFPYGVVDQYQVADHKQKSSGFNNNFTENSKGIMFQATNFQSGDQEAQSVINFKGGFNSCFMNNSQSMLNFEHNNQWSHNIINSPKLTTDPSHLSSNFNNFEAVNQNHDDIDDESNGWYYTEATVVTDCFDKSPVQDSTGNHKRPRNMGAECSTQASKKQCSSSSSSSSNKNKPKPKSSTQAASKDPQSIAAKNRRERISERLKVLQELVPNGSKVDLVTMLEKAINYVKFLQLQVKVLAADEFWPVQGGKPPDITQVKEAIDAILSSSQLKDTSTY